MFELPKDTGDVLELERAVRVSIDWARTHPNTLILVLADHETSGLVIEAERGQGQTPDHYWTTLNHTRQNAPIYALGVGAERVGSLQSNAAIPDILFAGTFNRRPTVSAGGDLTVTLPAGANLRATVRDDGLPSGSSVRQAWSVTAGPAPVTFSAPTQASTTASFEQPGVYVLRLTATDGVFSTWDELTVTVNPPGSANLAPNVWAGEDAFLQLPATLALAAVVSDDGLPNPPAALTFAWTIVSGPTGASIDPPDRPQGLAHFTQPGSYTLRLTVSDGALSASDELIVTVEAKSGYTVLLPALMR
jgi:hypothetical protein